MTCAAPPRALAQEPLSLDSAIARTLGTSPALRAAQAAERGAVAGLSEARAGWFPRLDYIESWQRSDQPVFVFGSLLAQSRFGPGNFAIDALNHPEAVSDLRGALTVQQSLVDPARSARVRAADAGRRIAALGSAGIRRELSLAVTRAYGRVLMATAQERAARAAVAAAEEDRLRTERRRDTGLATDADVLAFQVHEAGMRARLSDALGEQQVARATLNDLIGAPLDMRFALEEPAPRPIPPASAEVPILEREALERRETPQQARLRELAAAAGQTVARSAFLPRVGVQGGYEFDGTGWTGRQSWWAVGLEMRWNLFNGLADRARLASARAAVDQARADRERAENAVRLDVRSAVAALGSARARDEVGRAAVTQAREAHRIVRERYDAGMVGVTELLRAANALLDAELQQVSASVDVFVGEKTLDWAVGR